MKNNFLSRSSRIVLDSSVELDSVRFSIENHSNRTNNFDTLNSYTELTLFIERISHIFLKKIKG